MKRNGTQPRVLFVKLSAIGDIVMASGLPSNIKEGLNAAEVYWLVEAPYADFVRAHPCIDGVIPWPKQMWSDLIKQRKWLRLFGEVRSFRRQLKRLKADVAIDAQGLLKSAVLCWLSGAGRRVGFRSKEHSHWLLTESIDKPISDNMSSEYVSMGEYLGACDYSMLLPAEKHVQAFVNELRHQYRLNQIFIALCPFTTRPQKHWPQSHWQRLIALVQVNWSFPVVILGGPDDSDAADELAVTHDNAISLAGKLSLSASGALLAYASVVIGVDTGLTHLAIAHQRPVLALFGSTRPYTQTPAGNATVFYHSLPCAPCKRKPSCEGAYTCMAAIPPEQVVASLKNALDRIPSV
ncbi:glycosyltransferase family 9 protein [Aestuariibacter sp. A3R04]|nr:glycosyltransferase family 9 protein [Aestuariibacter sp. A3R04]MBU3020749.1 glycosyltransferase family 9 protein [Aestuariibacter sp. A3R04]